MKRRLSQKEKIEYGVTKKKNKEMRHYAPDPFSALSGKGIAGKAANKVGNTIIEKPIQNISYKLTSRNYKKGVDSPSKGSDLYNKNYFKIKKILKFIVCFLVAIMSGTTLIAFFKADIMGKISLSFGVSLVILIICFIKSLFTKKHK